MGCWEERQCLNQHCADLEWAWCHRADCMLSPVMEAPERLMAAGHQLNEAAHYLGQHKLTSEYAQELLDLRTEMLGYLQTFTHELAQHELANKHMLQSPHGKPSDS